MRPRRTGCWSSTPSPMARRSQARVTDRDHVHGRVRAVEPDAADTRQAMGAGRVGQRHSGLAAAADPSSDLQAPARVRHLMAGYDLSTNRLYGHITKRKGRTEFPVFCRYLRSLHPPRSGSRSSWTTSAHTARPKPTRGSDSGPPRTTSSWPTCRSTAPGSTGSRPSSPPCATSPSTALTTTATPNKPA